MATHAPRQPGGDEPSTWERAKPIFLALVLALVAFLGFRLVVELKSILILLFISLVLAAALWRPARSLEQRGVPRGLAVTLVELAALAVLLVVGWIVLPPLFNQAAGFAERVPTYVDRFQALRRDYAQLQQRYPGLDSFDAEVGRLAERVGSAFGARLVNLPLTTATLLFQLLT